MNGSVPEPGLSDRGPGVTRNTFYVLLAALIAADLVRSSFNACQYLRKPPVLAGVAPLDSFSEPSVAAAILKKEAELMLFDYTEARDDAWTIQVFRQHDSGPTNLQSSAKSDPHYFSGFARGSGAETLHVRPLEKLQSTVQDLSFDVCQKLLVVYSENHFDNEMLDTFLRVLQTAPERPEVLDWVRVALDRSRNCNRTEEVQDALQHNLRFHPGLKTAPQLAILKQSWEKAHLNSPDTQADDYAR